MLQPTVMMAFRIAWFKVHIPQAYYAAYFTIRAKAFDAEFMIFGKEKVNAKLKEIEALGKLATPKDNDMYDDLELVLEMYERGFKFLPIDLYKSHATKVPARGGGLKAAHQQHIRAWEVWQPKDYITQPKQSPSTP